MGTRILTVLSGSSEVHEASGSIVLDVPMTITVNPNGGTVTVSVKTSVGGTYQAVADGNLSGNITAVKMDVLKGPVNAIKFTAATQTATVEIAQ
ncbi:MAG: hypothetical protein IPK63_18740 [Candidatus Competibacteraceae bacterium]|nr:hypothetical protein [Candidatus Competibacteraceae bacterium]